MTGRSATGFGGAFAAMGEATTDYYDKLNKYDQQNEQKRQFDEQQKLATQASLREQQKVNFQRFDAIGKNFDDMDAQFETMGKYLDDEHRSAFRQMIDTGRAGVMSFYASPTGDESGFNAFNAQYGLDDQGKPKSWGATMDGQPINHDTILKQYYERKPVVDFKEGLDKTYATAASSFISGVLMDPSLHSEGQVAAAKQVLAGGTTPSQAMATLLASNATVTLDSMARKLTSEGFTPANLATAEDAFKLAGEDALKGADGKPLPQYTTIMNAIAQHKDEIADYRKGVAINQGGQTVLKFGDDSLTAEEHRFNFTQVKNNAALATAKDLDVVQQDGGVNLAKSAAGKDAYLRVNPGDEAGYENWVARTQDMSDMRQTLATNQVVLSNNTTLQSTMTTDQQTQVWNNIRDLVGPAAAAQLGLETQTSKNGLTEANFTATLLPKLLPLKGQQQLLDVFQNLSERPGGIGRASIEQAFAANLVDKPTYDNLIAYQTQMEGLRQKGINTEGAKLSAQWYESTVSRVTNTALLKAGVPAAIANTALSDNITKVATNLVTQLTAGGKAVNAFVVATADDEAAIATDRVTAQQQAGQLPGAFLVGQMANKTALSTGYTTLATNAVTASTARGALGQAYQVGASGQSLRLSQDGAAMVAAEYDRLVATGALPGAETLGREQGLAALSTAMLTSLQNKYQTGVTNGMMPTAGQLGAATNQTAIRELNARLETANQTITLMPDATAATKSQYASLLAQNKYTEALSLLKTQRIDFDTAMQDAGTVGALASIDPTGSLAELIKDPKVKAFYNGAVKNANDQRTLTNSINQYKAQKTGGGSDPLHQQFLEVGSAMRSNQADIDAVFKDPTVANAAQLFVNNYKSSITSDLAGRPIVTIPANLSPQAKQIALQAKAVIDAATKKAEPYYIKKTQLNERQNALFAQRDAQGQNPDGTAKPGATNTGGGQFGQPNNGANGGMRDSDGGVKWDPTAKVVGDRTSINPADASTWAAQNPQVTSVSSDCAAIVSLYYRQHGIDLPAASTSAGVEANAIAKGWGAVSANSVQPGDLLVYTGSVYGEQKSGGVGKHVVTVVGFDASGNPQVLENPGLLSNGNQGITQVTTMYPPAKGASVKAYRPPNPKAAPVATATYSYPNPNAKPTLPAAFAPPAPPMAPPAPPVANGKNVAPPAFKAKSDAIAQQYGVEPAGLLAFFGGESTFGTNTEGKDPTIKGIGQISKGAQDQVNQTYNLKLDRNNPDDNMRIAALYYKYVSGVVGSTDPAEVYAGYHDGPQTVANLKRANGGVMPWGSLTAEGQKGVDHIRSFYAANGGQTAAPAPTAAATPPQPVSTTSIPVLTGITNKYNPQQIGYLQSNPVFQRMVGNAKDAGALTRDAGTLAAQFLYDQGLISMNRSSGANLSANEKALLAKTKGDIMAMAGAAAAGGVKTPALKPTPPATPLPQPASEIPKLPGITSKYTPSQIDYLRSNPVFNRMLGNVKDGGALVKDAGTLAAQFLYDQKLISANRGSGVNLKPAEKALLDKTKSDIMAMVGATAAGSPGTAPTRPAAAVPAPNQSQPVSTAVPLTAAQKTAITAMPAFKQVTSGVMSPSARSAKSLELAADYMVQSGQFKAGKIDVKTMEYYGPSGKVKLPPNIVTQLQANAATIGRLGQQLTPTAKPIALGHASAVSYIPTLGKLPGNTAQNTASVLSTVANVITYPQNDAGMAQGGQEIVALVNQFFKNVPGNGTNAVEAQKKQLYIEIAGYAETLRQQNGGK